jgi:hypothetical protein
VLNIAGRARAVDAPVSIFLRHNMTSRWCGAGGDWLPERHYAVRFATNIDALVYCQALDVRGLLVAFDPGGREVYRLNVDRILDTMADDPLVRSLFHSRQ